MALSRTDFSLTLEELTGLDAGDPDDAPTNMVEAIIRSWKKPLNQLSDEEIGQLVVQHDGYPYVLDLVWPKLESDPLFDGGYYPGDVLSNLIRADPAKPFSYPDQTRRIESANVCFPPKADIRLYASIAGALAVQPSATRLLSLHPRPPRYSG
jgi:hypothetical protein